MDLVSLTSVSNARLLVPLVVVVLMSWICCFCAFVFPGHGIAASVEYISRVGCSISKIACVAFRYSHTEAVGIAAS